MKKQHLFIVLAVVLLGFVFAVCQYYQALKIEDVSAVTVGTPNPGHSLAQLECSANSFCVDTVNNRVGIGTANPASKLDVNGKLAVAGAITQGNGAYWTLDTTPVANDWTMVGSSDPFTQRWLHFGYRVGDVVAGAYTDSAKINFYSGAAVFGTNGGNVGIGTTNPSQKLEVNGNIKSTGVWTGTSATAIGININGSNAGGVALVMCSHNTDIGNNTSAAIYMVRYGYNGNNYSTTLVSGTNFITFSIDGSGNLLFADPSGGNCACTVFSNK